MRLPQFEYLTPGSIKEACSGLASAKAEGRVVAGGSDLLVRMRQRTATPRQLISLKGIPHLASISYDDEGLKIGAMAALHDIETAALIREKYPALCRAASRVASYQIRSTATIGGNICLDTRCWYYNQSLWWRRSRPPCYKTGGDCCHVVKGGDRCYAIFSGDLAPVLAAMDTKVTIAGPTQARVMALQDLYTGLGKPHLVLKHDEIITHIQAPAPAPNRVTEYVKFSLSKEVDFPMVGAGVSFVVNNDECSEARIVIGGVASGPVWALDAAKRIQGKIERDWSLQEIGQLAVKEIGPIVHIGVTPDYRRQMVRVITEQAIKTAIRAAIQRGVTTIETNG